MPARNRSWITNLFGKRKTRSAGRRPARPQTRFLRLEWLEPRRLLTVDYSSILAPLVTAMTPDPHPSGDLPANLSQVVPMSVFTAMTIPAAPPSDFSDQYVADLDEIFDNIQNNSAARPAYWGTNVPVAPHAFRLYLDDNGMNINSWTIDWGDGSDPQTVTPQPWVIHRYPAAGEYTIQVTADSLDGTYSGSTGSWVDTVGIGGSGGGGGGLQVTLADPPPTLHVGGAQTVALGQGFALDGLASFSYPDAAAVTDGVTGDFTYAIDWGDGTPAFNGSNVDMIAQAGADSSDSPFLGALASDAGDGPLTHLYAAAGDYDLAVTVTDVSSGLSDTQTIPVDVVQLAPTISSTYTSGNEGTPDAFTASVSTALTDPVAYQWQVLDSSGDLLAQGTDPTLDYNFTAPDTYTVSLTATVDNVTSAPAVQTVTVNNVAPVFVDTIPSVTLNVGQTYNLSATFTDVNPNDTHTAAVLWGDGSPVDANPTVTEELSDGTAPGTITDSYAYTTATSGTPYTATVTVTDSEGLPTSETFLVTVDAPTVALTSFGPDAGTDTNLEVGYTVAGGTAAPFNIEIYTSTDGTTPDQLLMTQYVDGSSGLPLGVGMDTAIFPVSFDDVPGDYHLIAVSDACSNTVEFAGGVFSATSVTASPPQTTLYVFGSAGGDTADIYGATNTVDFDSTNYAFGSATAIHVVGENGALTATADSNVSLPIAMDGGSGNDTFTGGGGNDTIVGGTGTNVIQSSNGVDSPQIVDDTDTGAGGVVNYFHVGDPADWSSETAAGTFDGGQTSPVNTSVSDTAVWTFDDLDPSAYYDVYVTWSPTAGASTGAQYAVKDDGTTLVPLGQSSIATVNQPQPPADFEAAGVYWHDLGVFRVTSAVYQTLYVQLSTDTTGEVLADAAMIVPDATIPLTNLAMDGFGVDADGNLSVSYTINGEDAAPFSIGIYQSADGVQPGALAGTIDVSDPDDLSGGGSEHTLTYQGSLNGLDGGPYYLAQLDAYDEVAETTKADNTSTPLTGVYEDASGSLYVLAANDGSNHSIAISEDPSTGDVSVTLDSGSPETFEDVSAVYVAAYHGANTINAAGIDLPLYVYGGDGSDTITGGDGDNTIYGGTAGGNTIYAGAGDDTIYGQGTLSNTIYGGSGTDTIYAGNGGDTIIGGAGNAEIYGGTGNDIIYGSAGNNWIQAGSGNATITGGPGNDWLIGGSGNDVITGGSGTEVIQGGSGTDTLTGGSGLDSITGGSGTNFIYGEGDHDVLNGGTGVNFIQPSASKGLASIEVENSSGSPTFDGNIDASGNSYTGDYQVVDGSNYGDVVTEWEFDSLDSEGRLGEDSTTPVAVYVDWQNTANPGAGDHWSNDVVYTVYDDGTALLSSAGLNQAASPGSASPETSDRPWDLLGVFNVPVGDTITVKLVNYDNSAGSMICVGDAMIHAIWPTVSIRATGKAVNPSVATANAGYYLDWLDAVQSIDIPLEGDGSRAEVQLTASVDPVYYQMSGSSTADWQAILPNVAGLEFWTAATGGTQLAPDGNGNLVAQQLSGTTGVYTGTVWASLSSESGPPSAPTLSSIGFAAEYDGSAKVTAKLGAASEPTFVVVLNGGSAQSMLGPAAAKLTPADVQWIAAQRAAYLSTLGDFSDPAMPGGYLRQVFQSVLSTAQAEVPPINAAIAQLATMEADPTVSDTTYRQAYLSAEELYDSYIYALVQVATAEVQYISEYNLEGFLGLDRLIVGANALPGYFPGLTFRGMYFTAAETTALKSAQSQISPTIKAYMGKVDVNSDKIDYEQGVIASVAFGAATILGVAAAVTLWPVTMAYVGVTLLAAGSLYSINSRVTNDHLSGPSLVASTLSDVSGYTALNIGLSNWDPVTHKTTNYTPGQQGWQLGSGFTALVTLGLGAENVVATLDMKWTSAGSFTPPPALQLAGGPPVSYTTAVSLSASADVSVGVAQLGGAQIVVMASRPGGGSSRARPLTPAEQATLTRLQKMFPQRNITESAVDDEEYVDQNGRTYEQIGNPAASTKGNMTQFLRSLGRHLPDLKSADFLVVDLTGFSAQDIEQVEEYLGTLPQATLEKIIRIGF